MMLDANTYDFIRKMFIDELLYTMQESLEYEMGVNMTLEDAQNYIKTKNDELETCILEAFQWSRTCDERRSDQSDIEFLTQEPGSLWREILADNIEEYSTGVFTF